MGVRISGRLELRGDDADEESEAMVAMLWLVGHLRQMGYDVDDVIVTAMTGDGGDVDERR